MSVCLFHVSRLKKIPATNRWRVDRGLEVGYASFFVQGRPGRLFHSYSHRSLFLRKRQSRALLAIDFHALDSPIESGLGKIGPRSMHSRCFCLLRLLFEGQIQDFPFRPITVPADGVPLSATKLFLQYSIENGANKF